MDFFVVTLSAQRANFSLVFHAFLFSSNNFLMILIKLLLEDSANQFPWG